MNGTQLAKVQKGDPLIIKANTFNAFIDAAVAHRRGRLGVGRTTTREAGQSVVVPIKNNSGADRSRYDVLGIDGPLFDPATYPDSFKQQVALKGITPVTSTHEGSFAILLEPVAAGSIGQAAIAGLTIVKVNVPDTDAEAFDFAEIADATTGYLVKSATGTARVVTIESGTGTKWAVVGFGSAGPSKLLSANHTDTKADAAAVAKGSMIVGSGDSPSVWDAVTIGANGKVWTVVGGTGAWADPPGGGSVTSISVKIPASTAAGEQDIHTDDWRNYQITHEAWYSANTPGNAGKGQWSYGEYGENDPQYGGAKVVNGIRVVPTPTYYVDPTIDVFEGGDVGFYIDKDTGHLKVDWTQHTVYDRLLRLDISRSYGTPDVTVS